MHQRKAPMCKFLYFDVIALPPWYSFLKAISDVLLSLLLLLAYYYYYTHYYYNFFTLMFCAVAVG